MRGSGSSRSSVTRKSASGASVRGVLHLAFQAARNRPAGGSGRTASRAAPGGRAGARSLAPAVAAPAGGSIT
jgi:hypothetical protein